ncbi:DivIVA domain-containing protein [Amycolatopsis antarctica]|uniref:Cell wall synthesis protein Wag31 n=1 Tax=Amycolatopsis antarctica TaxID=1854586 RepID=A0A263D7I1_9PSEU|nr:DivIVA domain-containing protein [Amycolatopsis antarctica]OZM73527.1 DivIVA domain-containing protein [Amycolatopsis antarctica]
MSLSAEDVYDVEFRNAPIGRRGYARDQVDEFLDRIAGTLRGEDDLTPAEVHHVIFGRPMIGKRGYDEREVDEFLDRVEDELVHLTGAVAPGVPCAREHDQATTAATRQDATGRSTATSSYPR